MIRLYLASNEVLNRWWPWDCEFELSLNSRPETISLFSGTPLGGAALDSVGGDDQLLGSVTLECGANITAPTLRIRVDQESLF